jgi:dTDP-4-dehydrorhamnose reductase
VPFPQRVLLFGGSGQLGGEIRRLWTGVDIVSPSHADVEITDTQAVARAIETQSADVVVNCAAFHNVDRCEAEPHNAFAAKCDCGQRNGGHTFIDRILTQARNGEPVRVVRDQTVSPTYAPAPYGLYHMVNEGAVTWYDGIAEYIRNAQLLAEHSPYFAAGSIPARSSRRLNSATRGVE